MSSLNGVISDTDSMNKLWQTILPQLFDKSSNKILDLAKFRFNDVWALEADMVPQESVAFLFCFPEQPVDTEDDISKTWSTDPMVHFLPQRVRNICASNALAHLATNLTRSDHYDTELGFTPLVSVKEAERETLPNAIEEDHVICKLQTSVEDVELQESLMCHYVVFIPMNGRLVELDGRKNGPVDHGPVAAGGGFIQSMIDTVKTYFVAVLPEKQQYLINLMAVCPV